MAKARAISKRLRANRNIRKITRTMQLIATSKYQQALNRATASRPFTDKIRELVEKMSAAAGEDVKHPLLTRNEGTGRSRGCARSVRIAGKRNDWSMAEARASSNLSRRCPHGW